MKELIAKKPNYRRICSVRGCGNRDTVLFARSVDMAGGLFICKACADEMYKYYSSVVTPAKEPVAKTAEEVDVDQITVEEVSAPEGVEEAPKPKARTGTRRNSTAG